jgi:hypothetical protein
MIPIFASANLIIYEMCLKFTNLQEFILKQESPSDSSIENMMNFLNLNKEGIVSLVGYTSTFLLSCYLGGIFEQRKIKEKEIKVMIIIILLIAIAWILFCLSCKYVEEPCRRLV